MNNRLYLLSFLISFFTVSFSQGIPMSTDNEALYEFIDELAASHYISVNQVVKPYSQKQVKNWLLESEFHYNRMTKRQQQEWQFYSDNIVWQQEDTTLLANRIDLIKGNNTAFSLSPLGFFSNTEKMTFALKPILKAQFYTNSNGTIYHRSVGAAMNLTVGNWGFYGNIQDYSEKETLAKSPYLVNMTGGNYKGQDYSDMRGGMTYANDWLTLGLVKDYVAWGTNQNGANIISDRAPSFAQIKLKIKPVEWFEFNYVHGFLVSDVIDSAESYVLSTGERLDVMNGKLIAANMLTFYPFKTLGFSVGNSIVYSADNAKVQYLNPLMFYKSVDHTYNSTDGAGLNVGQNSQMFLDISLRSIKNVFVYYTLFVDELKMERWKSKDEHNFYSYKAGVKFTQIIPNTSFGVEYTHTTPITYQHDVTTTTFESNSYNMGHYLRDNAEEFYTYVHFRPVKNLRFKLSYTHVRKGEEY
ncbi:MAG: hypothetical protein PF444_00320, partial [Bacteroidales bacterium]|nr:hypothetical protein [Bacteroidales bacterium]